MSNTNIPSKPNLINNAAGLAQISWTLAIKLGYTVEVHESSAQNGVYTLANTAPEGRTVAYLSGKKSRHVKLRSKRTTDGELSSFGLTLLIDKSGKIPFDQATELEQMGSSIHLQANGTQVSFDDDGDWVDALTFLQITRFREITNLKYTVAGGSPTNPKMRFVEKTSEMDEYLEKLVPQDLEEGTIEASFTPSLKTQQGSSLVLQIKCDAGGADGANFTAVALDYIEYTLGGL
jgi:hypothetical protein